MIRGIDLVTTTRYTLKRDPDKDTPDASVFLLGAIDSRVMARIRDASTNIVYNKNDDATITSNVNVNDMRFRTCMYGLRGWEKFADTAGKPLEFRTLKEMIGGIDYQYVDPEILRQVHPEDLRELADAIMEMNDVTVADAKN